MEKFNIYNQINKGLRASLNDCAVYLLQIDFTNVEEIHFALSKIKQVEILYKEHIRKERLFILPALAIYEPSVCDAMEQEHNTCLDLAEQIYKSLIALNILTNNERLNAGNQLSIYFVSFLVNTLQHLAKEENVLHKLLWRYYDHASLKLIQQQILNDTTQLDANLSADGMHWHINNTKAVRRLYASNTNTPAIVYHTL
jgi:hypothetical protein